MARLANLVVYVLMAAGAVRLVPIQKWTMAMVALMPMSLYLGASLSADAVTLGLSLLIVALTLNLALRCDKPGPRSNTVRGRVCPFVVPPLGGFSAPIPPKGGTTNIGHCSPRKAYLALGLLLTLLALSKQAYVGLAGLFLLVPGKRFSSPGRRWLTAAAVIGVPLAINAAWMYSLRGLYVPMSAFVDPPAQLPLDLEPSLELRFAGRQGDLPAGELLAHGGRVWLAGREPAAVGSQDLLGRTMDHGRAGW